MSTNILRIACLSILVLATQGCGNKGPLYLPAPESAAGQQNNQPSSKKP